MALPRCGQERSAERFFRSAFLTNSCSSSQLKLPASVILRASDEARSLRPGSGDHEVPAAGDARRISPHTFSPQPRRKPPSFALIRHIVQPESAPQPALHPFTPTKLFLDFLLGPCYCTLQVVLRSLRSAASLPRLPSGPICRFFVLGDLTWLSGKHSLLSTPAKLLLRFANLFSFNLLRAHLHKFARINIVTPFLSGDCALFVNTTRGGGYPTPGHEIAAPALARRAFIPQPNGKNS